MGREAVHKQKCGSQKQAEQFRLPKKRSKHVFAQAIAVSFLNNSTLLSCPLFLENKEEKAKGDCKTRAATVEEENNLCAQFSLFCRGRFTMLRTGSNLQEPQALTLPIKVLDFSPGEITIFQFYASYKGLEKKMK